MNVVATRTTAEMAVKSPVPTRLYAEGGKLFVHTGASFRMVGQVGDMGTMTVSGEYPQNAFKAKSMEWLHDKAGVAQYVATAVNSYPVLTRRVRAAEAMSADMAAKLAVAAEALKRGPLKPEYAASLARELELCVARYKA